MKTTGIAACISMALAGSAAAEGEPASPWSLSGNVSLTSDYIFRGFTQTLGDPALQGTLTLSHESGFYASVFGSNVDFGDGETDLEVDLTAGYNFALDDATTFDVSAAYYAYPNEPDGADYGYWELVGVLAHDFGGASVSLKTALTPEFFGQTGTGIWLAGGVSVPFTDWLSASGNAGYQWIEDNAALGLPDYLHYDAGFTLSAGGFFLDLRYFGTDIDGAKEKFVGTLGFSF